MTTAGPPTLESLAHYIDVLVQQNEQMQTNIATLEDEKQQIVTKLTSVEAEATTRITNLEAQVNLLTANTTELERKLNIKATNARDGEMKRIMNTNLLKGQEFAKFTKKIPMSYGSTELKTICLASSPKPTSS